MHWPEWIHIHRALLCVFTDSTDRDSESEGPGPGAAPGPDQASLHHQHRKNGRDPGQIAAHWQPDCHPVLHCGNYESHVWRGVCWGGTTLLLSNSKVSRLVLNQCILLHTNEPGLTPRLLRMQSEKSGNQSNKCYGVLWVWYLIYLSFCALLLHRSGMRCFRGLLMSRKSMKVRCHQPQQAFTSVHHFVDSFNLVEFTMFTDSSPASWPDAAEAGERLPDHHRQTDQPLHPVHRQGQGETRAQVLYLCCPSAAALLHWWYWFYF